MTISLHFLHSLLCSNSLLMGYLTNYYTVLLILLHGKINGSKQD